MKDNLIILLLLIILVLLLFPIGKNDSKEDKCFEAIDYMVATRKQLNEDAYTYSTLKDIIEARSKEDNLDLIFPLWMWWAQYDYKIHDPKTAGFLHMKNDEEIMKSFNNYKNRWKQW